MDNPRFTNMNIPKFIQILDGQLVSCIIRKYGETIWYVSVLFRFLHFCLFFVGDSPKVSINQMPPVLSSLPPTPKHTQKQQRHHRNQFFFLLRVRDSHQDYGPQPFRQSSRKVSSNTKLFHLVFGFTFFSLVMDYSRVLFKPSRPQLFLDFFLSFSFFSFPHIIIFLVLLILFSPVLIVSMLINLSLSLSLSLEFFHWLPTMQKIGIENFEMFESYKGKIQKAHLWILSNVLVS